MRNPGGRRPRTVCALATLATTVAVATVAAGAQAAVLPGGGPSGLPRLTAVGVPYVDDGTGAVDVFFADGRRQRVGPVELGLVPAGTQTWFGSSVATADLDNDGLTDLVVGAQGNGLGDGEDENSDTWITPPGTDAAPGDSGRAWILLNSADGFTADGVVKLEGPNRVGDLLGMSVAVGTRYGSVGHDVWVGAPGLTVAGHPEAGVLYRFSVTSDATPSLADTIDQDSPLVPGAAEQDDQFGRYLAPAANGVVVGVPEESVGTKTRAGAVYRMRTDRTTDHLTQAQVFTQNSRGVPGAAEKNDEFGSAVAADLGSGTVAVGAPGENLSDGRTDAGLVQLFGTAAGPKDSIVPAGSLTQASPGVPGSAEAFDRFGAAVAVGPFACSGVTSLAVGVPDEDIGANRDTGSVLVTKVPGAKGSCPTKALAQAANLPGAPEPYDLTGERLSVVHGGSTPDRLLIAAPGETGTDGTTGRVLVWQGSKAATSIIRPIADPHMSFGFAVAVDTA
ncbi:FG-GAP repeat protein [Spongisporangium articulatum]|uniref:FG-GAP repeat protein n=1 Tax=Spongisporangium articulatum TaxID=3362603 RepID=A0ABW8ASR6_9ACTN